MFPRSEMSVSASYEAVSQERTLSSLLAGRAARRPKREDAPRLHEAAVQLLQQQQSLCGLLREVGNGDPWTDGEQKPAADRISPATACSFLVSELRQRAAQLGVPVAALSVKAALERLTEITGGEEEEEEEEEEDGGRRELLTGPQRAQLCALLQSSRELLSQGALCPKLLWREYSRDQKLPKLEVVYHLHSYSVLSLKSILASGECSGAWLVSGLKALCCWTPPQGDEESRRVQRRVLSAVVQVLVGSGFEAGPEPAGPDRRVSLLCCSVLDEMLSWLLDTVDQSPMTQSAETGLELWIQTLDASLCGVSASAEALRRFLAHSLTQTLTHRPRLAVSDAIALQNQWTFAKSSRWLTALFCKLAVASSVEPLLRHLQQVLETHEVNWRHVLCFLSTLLVYEPRAQSSLRELLSRLLSSAFEGYDLESMITAFLLARQGALEGPGIFPSYSDWFKMSFGGGSGPHAASKKSLVFLLKFLSDLVPFEPPQYLKVHVLHPPYVPLKHRGLLTEYTSLARTRLADLRESVEDMGLYEDASGAGGAAAQPQCQAAQDVDKAVSLFDKTGRISATVMEASIFRRPYFLTRFLPALLAPRVLPVKADARMRFIEALRKADKIPAAQHLAYVESCHRQRQQDASAASPDPGDDPLEVLGVQLQELTGLVAGGSDAEMLSQLSRISHTLSVAFPGHADEPAGRAVIELRVEAPPGPELHVKAVSAILRTFCQCTVEASRANPPNKQGPWASRFVGVLLANTQLLSSLVHRLWDLLHNQMSSLSPAHLLGLAVFVVHLHVSVPRGPLVRLVPPVLPEPVPVAEALSSALVCGSRSDMLSCVRLCVAAVGYGICRADSPQQDCVPSGFYKKLLYLVPRLLPEARRGEAPADAPQGAGEHLDDPADLWGGAREVGGAWRKSALCLWTHPAFRQLEDTPRYRLLFSEWLADELRVQRGEDALSDPERQEYQQWACSDLYWSRPVEWGGCGGDARSLCSHLLNAVMDQQSQHQSSDTGTCLPDILSRLQELVYEMEATDLPVCDFLFDFLSRRCSSVKSSDSLSVGSELSMQQTLTAWNRIMLALPAKLLVKTQVEGGRTTLDCNGLIEHVNQHQRRACPVAGVLPCHVTSHFLRGVLCASARCRRPREEVNEAWSQISLRCPLLLTSGVHWWQRLSPALALLWGRLSDGEPLPEQLQLLTDCQRWAGGAETRPLPAPSAPALLLASCLHRAWRGRGGGGGGGFGVALNALQLEGGKQTRQVLVFLLFLCVRDHLSALLCPQERGPQTAGSVCGELLSVLADSADWLFIFTSDRGVYQSVTMVTSDEFTRLMPWAFFSLLLQQSAELLQRAARCPGFLHAATSCYVSLMQLVLDGDAPTAEQPEPSHVLSGAKRFLLQAISQTPPTALTPGQLTQLEHQCADLDPEVAAALSVLLNPRSLSPEMDFL